MLSDNETAYSRRDVVEHYARAAGLHGAERALLPPVDGLRVLDLGVGAGRTSPFLSRGAGRYVGVDCSPPMVERCRRKHPGLTFLLRDASDLAGLGRFDLAVFSFNGIDYCGLEQRREVLEAVARALVPGGVLLFSSHNLGYARAGMLPWQGRRPGAGEAARALLHSRRRRRMKAKEVRREGAALLNDGAHGWSLLTAYVSRERQEDDLSNAGFHRIEVFGQDGTRSRPLSESVWLYYRAERR